MPSRPCRAYVWIAQMRSITKGCQGVFTLRPQGILLRVLEGKYKGKEDQAEDCFGETSRVGRRRKNVGEDENFAPVDERRATQNYGLHTRQALTEKKEQVVTHRHVGFGLTAKRIRRTTIAEEASGGGMILHLVLSLNASNDSSVITSHSSVLLALPGSPHLPPILTSPPSHVRGPLCHDPALDDFPHNHQRPSIQRTSVAIPRSIAPKPVPIQTFSTTISAVTASLETALPAAVLPAN
ncbi:hypothetical protein NMY22_g1474 [Coprinellus aureogranulatus]|nr:hypothetical protein NMY22_g1474 [Coprinellus aureogranulatus]